MASAAMNTDVMTGILIPFLGTAAGAGCVFFMKKSLSRGVQRALTGFASGVMVAASIWSLIISIARAMLKGAPIVLLDEATASLDVENETKVQGALSRLLEGKTVLVIAHRMRTVEAADRVIVLADGKVAEQGTPAELISRQDGIFRRMTLLQASSAEWSI